MKAVILAAGEGTRLRPFTASEPKVMVPVANKPIMQYVIESLVDNGITDIVIVVGYRKQRIMSYFKEGEEFNADIRYVTQKKQLGTAHSLLQAKSEVGGEFMVLPGDNVISEKTVSDFLKDRTERSVLITESEEPSKYGVTTLTNGVVDELVEKPEKSPSHLISTGIYSFTPEVFDFIEELMEEQTYDLTSVVQRMMKSKRLTGIRSGSMWIDAVHPWDLIHLNSAALNDATESINGVVENTATIKGDVMVGKGATVKGGSYIQGPAIIGEGCEIGPHACILPSTTIGEDSKVEPFTVVQNSLLMKSVEIGPNSRMENSVIGDGVNIGGNFSTFVGEAEKYGEEEVLHIEGIGCMTAEDTSIGGGVTTEPGVIIGAGCEIRSGRTIREDLPSNCKVF